MTTYDSQLLSEAQNGQGKMNSMNAHLTSNCCNLISVQTTLNKPSMRLQQWLWVVCAHRAKKRIEKVSSVFLNAEHAKTPGEWEWPQVFDFIDFKFFKVSSVQRAKKEIYVWLNCRVDVVCWEGTSFAAGWVLNFTGKPPAVRLLGPDFLATKMQVVDPVVLPQLCAIRPPQQVSTTQTLGNGRLISVMQAVLE